MYKNGIKDLKKILKITTEEMANRLNMSVSTLSSYERCVRTPSADFLAQLYEKMDVNINWFLSGCGEMFLDKSTTQNTDLKSEILEEVRKMFTERGL